MLFGGLGADSLTGGAGADTYFYAAAAESGIGAGFRDVITDFNVLEDQIDIADLFTGAFAYLDTAAFTNTGSAQARLNGSVLEFDLDGNTAVDMEIDVTGYTGGAITLSNFFVDQPGGGNQAPVIANLDGDVLNYTEGSGAQVIDNSAQFASVTDADNANFFGGSLTAAITAGLDAAEDVLGLQAGNVTFSGTSAGSTVSVFGNVVGTLTLAIAPGNNLAIAFDQTAGKPTLADVNEILRAITYENIDAATATTGPRTVSVTVSDGAGGTSAAALVSVNVADSGGGGSIITGTVGNDDGGTFATLTGTTGNDTFIATTGDDTIDSTAAGGVDLLDLGLDFDLIGGVFDGTNLVLDLEKVSDQSPHSVTILNHLSNSVTTIRFDADGNGSPEILTIATAFETPGSVDNLLLAGTAGGGDDRVWGAAAAAEEKVEDE